MLISGAGRVAKAFFAETPGGYRPGWTIEQLAGRIEVIGSAAETLCFPVVSSGFCDHLRYNFEMARKGA
jgi:hypothetical protein